MTTTEERIEALYEATASATPEQLQQVITDWTATRFAPGALDVYKRTDDHIPDPPEYVDRTVTVALAAGNKLRPRVVSWSVVDVAQRVLGLAITEAVSALWMYDVIGADDFAWLYAPMAAICPLRLAGVSS